MVEIWGKEMPLATIQVITENTDCRKAMHFSKQ
jgi:hypothetical protein